MDPLRALKCKTSVALGNRPSQLHQAAEYLEGLEFRECREFRV